jgi:hypothetical protein
MLTEEKPVLSWFHTSETKNGAFHILYFDRNREFSYFLVIFALP